MKPKSLLPSFALALLACVLEAMAQSTVFTYQGRLHENGSPVSGAYDLRFAIYDSTNSPGILIAGPHTNSAVVVSNGLFTATLDFGSAPFDGNDRFLEIAARTNDATAFTVLAPRQPLTATPYAIRASTAGLAAAVVDGAISSAALADGAVTAAKVVAGAITSAALADGSIIAAKISPGAVTGPALAAGAVTAAKIADGSIIAAKIAPGAVNTVALADGAVMTAKIAPGAVSHLSSANGLLVNAVQVDESGLVGVGTNAPRAGLDIVASGSVMAPRVLFQAQDGTGSYTNLAGIRFLAAFNNQLAIGSMNDNGVTLLNVSNPQFPVILAQFRDGVGVYTNLSYPYPALKTGLLAVASYHEDAVTLIDINNPAAPVKVAELRDGVGGWDGLNGAFATVISNNLLVVAAYDENAVTLADISNPAAPVLRALLRDGQLGFDNLLSPSCLAVSGSLLAVGAGSDNAVTLIDVSNPANPILLSSLKDGVGGFSGLDGVNGVAIAGNLLAIAAFTDSTVTLVDISNPSSPVKLAEIQQALSGPLTSAFGVGIVGSRLAVSSTAGLTLFDVANPALPKLLAEATDGRAGIGLLRGLRGVVLTESYAAVAGQTDNTLSLLDFSVQPAGIFSQGWVGVGTANPRAALNVIGSVVVEQADVLDVNAARIELGLNAHASGEYSAAIGYASHASGDHSTALGNFSTAGGNYSLAAGYNAAASGTYSVALGYRAQAAHQGAFVWADSQGSTFSSTAQDQFLIDATGGVGIGTATPGNPLTVEGSGTANGGLLSLAVPEVAARFKSTTAANHSAVSIDSIANQDAILYLAEAGTAVWGLRHVAAPNHDFQIRYHRAGANTTMLTVATNGSVGIGTTTPQDALLDVEGDIRVNDFDLYLRPGSERNHGLGYRASLAGLVGEGPFLYGFNGGALGVGNPDNAILTWTWDGHVTVSNSVSASNIRVDRSGENAGELVPGILFGGGNTGEGIASKRTAAGGNQYGLDFFTAFQNRMSINNNGRVGIGTTSPSASLSVSSAAGSQALDVAGSRSGNFSSPVAYIQNTNSSGSSGPALRLLGQGNAVDGVLNIGNTGTGKIVAFGAVGGEVASLDTNGNFSFGTTTRQMLNLWGTVYGIGVQNNTLYTRSDSGFAWFNKGSHSDNANVPGSGGTALMTLDSSGNLRTVTGTISTLSDRNAKTRFEPVDAREVLERLASLPITRWSFTNAPASQRHIGPMAQDFHAAFNVGLEATGICTVDADGVALAAIQGLNQKMDAENTALREELKRRDAENAGLKQRLERLERLILAADRTVQ